MSGKISSISKDEFKEKLDSGEYTLIDVRTEQEHQMQKIAESDVFDVSQPDFLERLKNLDKNGKYLIYCASGARSGQVLRIMEQMGFVEVFDLEGGILNWG